MSKEIFQPSEDQFYEHIFKDYNKTKADLEEYIDILKKWCSTQPHFPETPSYRILRFVVVYNKFSIETAKERLDMYYLIGNLIPEMRDSHPLKPHMILQSKITYCIPLPKITPDFKRIIFSQINPDFDSDVFVQEKFFQHVNHVIEMLIQEDSCYNFHFIFDSKGMKLSHVVKFSPLLMKKAAFILEQVYSSRVASIYLVNFHPFMEAFLNNIILPALPDKLKTRIRVYSNYDILYEVFGKDCLPKDIGGCEKSLDELNDLLLKTFETHKDRFDFLEGLKVDEKVRPQKLENDEILGYYGHFRKIDVD